LRGSPANGFNKEKISWSLALPTCPLPMGIWEGRKLLYRKINK
jgi:hypothetical protein